MSELAAMLAALRERFSAAAGAAKGERDLDEVRVAYLGRNGELTTIRRGIGSLPVDERPSAGKQINDAVDAMEALLAQRRGALESSEVEAELAQRIDVTFPAIPASVGSIHPVRRVIEDACAYFERHGFAVVLGPEVEPDFYNFDALNIPSEHPAREGFDSFWIDDTLLLRPHTSPMQIRTMQLHRPPIAIVAPGKCYRRDAVGIHFGHLKGMLTGLCRTLFGVHQRVRFRPSFFPFTEPSAEVDTTCPKCGGTGVCGMCGGSGWIELGGAGMVHPNVLRDVGYDPEVVTGWAFGFGAERIALSRYEVDDVRRFIDSDPDFLEQLA